MSKLNYYNNYNNILKRVLLFILVLAIGVVANLSGYLGIAKVYAADNADINYTKIGSNELRGVWIASVLNINFPSKTGLSANEMQAELDAIIQTCKDANLNAIFFQVRPTGDALYDSGIFPTSKYLTGKQGDSFKGGFDPLKYIINAAHKNNIELHAWINPYRITNEAAEISDLAANNPARLNPSWAVKYSDGKLFYNPGLPEVQELVTEGVIEIIKNYDVDGIHFDDYFYPGTKFDDDSAYKKYGSAYKTIDDFRRASVNKLIEKVYNAIKKENKNIRFGISPRGIWKNQSSDPTGSDTSGAQSYYDIYCDSKAWINGGYIDYICPQIYWAFDKAIARYDKLVRWWSAVVDGTGVDLYIGHAIYSGSSSFKDEVEIPRQVEYARNYMGVAGSVFYGYADLAANNYKIKDNLKKLFASPLKIAKPKDNGGGVVTGRPASGSTVTESSINITGGSNPIYPVYYKGEKLTRTKSGYFSVFVPLINGKNNIVFTQNNTDYTHILTKSNTASGPPSAYVYPQMNSYKIEVIRPADDIVTTPGDKITVRVQAPSKSTVTASIGGMTANLSPLTDPPDEGAYMTEVYQGTLTLPNTQPKGELINLGNIIISAARGNEKAAVTGINIKLINESAYSACEVINEYSHIKISTTSSFYEDYLPASVGMRDNVIGFKDGYYRLGFGGWVAAENVVLTPEKTLLVNRLLSAAMEDTGKITEIRFAVTEHVPVNAYCIDGVFSVTLYNTPDGARQLNIKDNPIFKSVRYASNKSNKTVTYTLELIDPDNWYGFELVYDGGFIVINVKNPIKKITGSQPLKGLTVMIDAGHGGTDTGALGFLGVKGKNEEDFNLEIALALKTKLIALGANVVMMRETDITMDSLERIVKYMDTYPDLLLSIHHNSLTDGSDLSLVRGVLPLYCDDAGRLLAKSVGPAVASELNRYERATRSQLLFMCRSHKFPSALIEMSFISNPDEYEFTANPAGIQRSANALANGIIAWIDNQQKWVK